MIFSLYGGYEEVVEWLDVIKDVLFNCLCIGGD